MSVFSREDVERGRRYHRPRYVSLLAEFLLAVAALAVLAFTGAGDALLPDWPWWAQALVYPALVLLVLAVLQLPLTFWRGHVHERRWGLSTQGAGGWALDRVKTLGVSIVITTALFFGLFGLARWTEAWAFVAAPLAATFVLVLLFVSPVVLEPIFNKFEPLKDETLANDLRALADRAGVPVRDVLVADASRRTAKENAYVSGFGATRRLVLFDTLLERSGPAELRAVLAHELGHRKYRDILTFAGLGVVAAVVLVLGLRLVLGDAARPRDIPLALFVVTIAQPLLLVAVGAVSRRLEYRADRFALLVTRDLGALERTFRRLVESNVSDLEPPRIVYWLVYGHPTVPERVAALREVATLEGLTEEAA